MSTMSTMSTMPEHGAPPPSPMPLGCVACARHRPSEIPHQLPVLPKLPVSYAITALDCLLDSGSGLVSASRSVV